MERNNKYPQPIKTYSVFLNGESAKPEKARVSLMPFNRHWPGYQRKTEQTEVVDFYSFDISKECPVQVRIVADFDFKEVVIRPLSYGYRPFVNGREVIFTITKPGQCVAEFDGHIGALTFFADGPELPIDLSVRSGNRVLYYGPGEHDIGVVELEDNTTVYVARGATVYGEFRAEDKKNITVAGRGIIDHSKAQPEQVEGHFIDPPRPSPLVLQYCANVTVRDVTFRDPCFLCVRPICCENVEIDNIKVIGCWRNNSDGIDPINCVHGRIHNCFVRSFDDSLCLKGVCSMFKEQLTHNGKAYDTMEDVIYENCVVWNDWGIALEVGLDIYGKEMKNCAFRNIDVIHSTLAVMDLRNVDNAFVHDIVFEDIRVEYEQFNQRPIEQDTEETVYPIEEKSDYMARLIQGDIFYIECYSAFKEERSKIHNITFRNIGVTAPGMPPSSLKGFSEEYDMRNISIHHLTLNGKPVRSAEDANIEIGPFVNHVTIDGITVGKT